MFVDAGVTQPAFYTSCAWDSPEVIAFQAGNYARILQAIYQAVYTILFILSTIKDRKEINMALYFPII